MPILGLVMPKALLPSTQEAATSNNFFTFEWFTYLSQLFTRVGGNKDYSLGGLLATDTDPVGNVNGGEDNLITYSMPKNTLGADNDVLEIIAFGTFADNANNKTVSLVLGSTDLFNTGAVAFRNQDWCIKSTVIRVSATSQKAITTFYTDYADITNIVDYVAPAENLTTTLTIKCTGEATATNDIVQQGLIIKNFPR